MRVLSDTRTIPKSTDSAVEASMATCRRLYVSLVCNGFSLDERACLTSTDTALHWVLAAIKWDKLDDASRGVTDRDFPVDSLMAGVRSYVAGYANPARVSSLGSIARTQMNEGHVPSLRTIGASESEPDVLDEVRFGFGNKLTTFLREIAENQK